MPNVADGYYWFEHLEGTLFVALHEEGKWYIAGLAHAVNLDVADLLGPVERPHE